MHQKWQKKTFSLLRVLKVSTEVELPLAPDETIFTFLLPLFKLFDAKNKNLGTCV